MDDPTDFPPELKDRLSGTGRALLADALVPNGEGRRATTPQGVPSRATRFVVLSLFVVIVLGGSVFILRTSQVQATASSTNADGIFISVEAKRSGSNPSRVDATMTVRNDSDRTILWFTGCGTGLGASPIIGYPEGFERLSSTGRQVFAGLAPRIGSVPLFEGEPEEHPMCFDTGSEELAPGGSFTRRGHNSLDVPSSTAIQVRGETRYVFAGVGEKVEVPLSQDVELGSPSNKPLTRDDGPAAIQHSGLVNALATSGVDESIAAYPYGINACCSWSLGEPDQGVLFIQKPPLNPEGPSDPTPALNTQAMPYEVVVELSTGTIVRSNLP